VQSTGVAVKSARYVQPLSPPLNSHGDQRRIGGLREQGPSCPRAADGQERDCRAAIISHFKRPIPARWGSEHGDFTMTDREWKVRRDQLERYRVLEEETTDPLAAGLLHDIVLELEAELKMAATAVDADAKP
jgi:hypothetical protein